MRNRELMHFKIDYEFDLYDIIKKLILEGKEVIEIIHTEFDKFANSKGGVIIYKQNY